MGLQLHAAALVAVLLLLVPTSRAAAAGVQTDDAHGPPPSAASLDGCQTSCGDLTFAYPFGTGARRCFHDPGFELICSNTTTPPRLFLRDGATEVLENIDPYWAFEGRSRPTVISVRPDVDVYNVSLKAPAFGPFKSGVSNVEITACGFLILSLQNIQGQLMYAPVPGCEFYSCSSDEDITAPPCSAYISEENQLQFIRIKGGLGAQHPNRSSLWDKINVTTTSEQIPWALKDTPRCAACVSTHSNCLKDEETNNGYWCICDNWYVGNPYVLNGCSRYNELDGVQRKNNCHRLCGNITVEFPFGLEGGCHARDEFRLKCTRDTPPILIKMDTGVYASVSEIDINDGLIKFNRTWTPMFQQTTMYSTRGVASSLEVVEWAVDNVTCHEAKRTSVYVCVALNSRCQDVNLTKPGYRCKCDPGFEGNPYVPDGCRDIDECKATPDICGGRKCYNTVGHYSCARRRSTILIGLLIGLCVAFGVLLLVLCAIFVLRRWKRDAEKRQRRKYFRENQGLLLEQLISSDETASDKTKIFSLEEMEKATNNFDPTRILGRGGHGMVYKGILSDQRVVAIKRSNIIEQSEINQFINEVVILSQINHRNIVKLFGCCLETEVPLLVYDFIPNGSLFECIHSGPNRDFHLSWDDCLRIATEAAGALCYLHSAASVSIFHRDVKSSNILIDANYTAKVSDFGASRLVSTDQTHVSTLVQGTFGYLDPEYYHTGQLSQKSDVYSFGVVLLELLLRKEPIFTSESGSKQNLSRYFLWESKTRPITDIVAEQVRNEATEEEIGAVASLAEMCLKLRGEERPNMKEVEIALQAMRTKRLKLSQVAANKNNEEIHELLHARPTDTTDQSFAQVEYSPEIASYSLEQEFLSSAKQPRWKGSS